MIKFFKRWLTWQTDMLPPVVDYTFQYRIKRTTVEIDIEEWLLTIYTLDGHKYTANPRSTVQHLHRQCSMVDNMERHYSKSGYTNKDHYVMLATAFPVGATVNPFDGDFVKFTDYKTQREVTIPLANISRTELSGPKVVGTELHENINLELISETK